MFMWSTLSVKSLCESLSFKVACILSLLGRHTRRTSAQLPEAAHANDTFSLHGSEHQSVDDPPHDVMGFYADYVETVTVGYTLTPHHRDAMELAIPIERIPMVAGTLVERQRMLRSLTITDGRALPAVAEQLARTTEPTLHSFIVRPMSGPVLTGRALDEALNALAAAIEHDRLPNLQSLVMEGVGDDTSVLAPLAASLSRWDACPHLNSVSLNGSFVGNRDLHALTAAFANRPQLLKVGITCSREEDKSLVSALCSSALEELHVEVMRQGHVDTVAEFLRTTRAPRLSVLKVVCRRNNGILMLDGQAIPCGDGLAAALLKPHGAAPQLTALHFVCLKLTEENQAALRDIKENSERMQELEVVTP